MNQSTIRVGFIGLNPESHWGAMAHVPALASLPHLFKIVGVANSSPESSRRTAAAFQLPYAFPSPAELVASPDVDLVVVTVKVPHHFELVSAALQVGKHVYCEWPLGNGVAEARGLAELASRQGVVAAVGTQAKLAVEVQHLRQLIADGYVGKVLSSHMIGAAGSWGASTTADYAYMFDAANGATIQSIPMAHSLAGLVEVLGPIKDVAATTLSQSDTVAIVDTGVILPRTSPNQVMLQGALASGAAFSVHYRGGQGLGTNFLWEIHGTDGVLQVVADSGHAQIAQLLLKGASGADAALQELTPPPALYAGWPDTAMVRNVARLYACIAADIRSSSRTAPTFDDAVVLHEVIDAIERSADTGQKVSLRTPRRSAL